MSILHPVCHYVYLILKLLKALKPPPSYDAKDKLIHLAYLFEEITQDADDDDDA